MIKKIITSLFFTTIVCYAIAGTPLENPGNEFQTNLNGFSYTGGAWTIDADGLHSNATGNGDCFLFSTAQAQNFVFEADVKFNNRNASAASLIFCSDNNIAAKNMYVANIHAHNGEARVFKFQDNSAIDLTEKKEVPLPANDTYHLKLTVIGKHIVFHVNNNLVSNTADYTIGGIFGQNDALFGGYMGLLSWNADCVYQNVYFQEITPENTPQFSELSLSAPSGEIEHNLLFHSDQYLYIAHVSKSAANVKFNYQTAENTTVTLEKGGTEFPDNADIPLSLGNNLITITSTNSITNAQIIYKVIIIRAKQDEFYNEPYRGQYHFSVRQGWANDPNGMVFYNGEYHLFHQYYYGITWGFMHWGHSVSADLLHWEELPVTFYPDEYGTMFSGCAVVDENNTSGLFTDENGTPTPTGGIVALITADGNGERVIAAYSQDGRTWKKHESVLIDWTEDPLNDAAFRDPKVFRYQGKWFMVIAGGPLRIYSSGNLLDWQVESTYPGLNTECPDLVRLPVYENNRITGYKWLLSYAGRTFKVGDFSQIDGKWKFVPLAQYETDNGLMNFGKDSYAFQTYYQGEFGDNQARVTGINWVNNFDYHNTLSPAMGNTVYNGTFSLQTELSLIKTASGQYRLQQKPLVEYQALRDNANAVSDNNRSLDNNSFVYNSASKSYEIVVKFSLKTASEAGFKIHKGDENYALVGYQKAGKKIFIDRTHLGGNVPAYLQRSEFAIPDIDNSNVELHIFVDRNTIEVFAGDYRIAGTAMIFPCENCTDLEMYATGGAATADVQIFPLKSIWNENFTNGISSVYFNSDEISLKQIDKKLFKVINIENGSARFFDLSGRLIKRFPIINPESIIDLSDVDSGIFLLNIISGSKNKTFKINLV